jgi:hypothetical protein
MQLPPETFNQFVVKLCDKGYHEIATLTSNTDKIARIHTMITNSPAHRKRFQDLCQEYFLFASESFGSNNMNATKSRPMYVVMSV